MTRKLSEFSARREKLFAHMRENKLDAAIVSSPINVRYLTGFTGSNSLLLTSPGLTILYTDPRYATQVRAEADAPRKQVVRGPLLPALVASLEKTRFRDVVFEGSHLTFDTFDALSSAVPKRAQLSPLGPILEQLRSIKSPSEIDAIRASVQLNSRAFDAALRRFRPAMTERDLAAELDHQMRLLGAEHPAFDTIVATGPHGAYPHAHPENRSIKSNALLLIDMGAQAEGYASDMTRMAFPGKPSATVRSRYKAVLEAQLAAIDAVKHGVPAAKVDRAARAVLRRHGLDKRFIHSTGHGLGLEIHEMPRIGKKADQPLEAGMAITIEPGIYIEGWGGIRIEDTVLVTAAGSEVLTPTPKELLVL